MTSKRTTSSAAYKPLFEKKTSIFTDCYCEENVYKLCEQASQKKLDLDALKVVFISSPDERVPMWCQAELNRLTVWDYHVILIHKNEKMPIVYDLSSKLAFPITFTDYVLRSFLLSYFVEENDELLELLSGSRFRVVDAKLYLENFSSDRSHMYDAQKQKWLAPPPVYEAIIQADNQTGEKTNLHLYRDMKPEAKTCEALGKVLTFEQFCAEFGIANVNDVVNKFAQ